MYPRTQFKKSNITCIQYLISQCRCYIVGSHRSKTTGIIEAYVKKKNHLMTIENESNQIK